MACVRLGSLSSAGIFTGVLFAHFGSPKSGSAREESPAREGRRHRRSVAVAPVSSARDRMPVPDGPC